MRPGYLDRRGPDPVRIECPDCLAGLAEVYTAGRCCGEACDCTTAVTCTSCDGAGEILACVECHERPQVADDLPICRECELEADRADYAADLEYDARIDA
jgi:RecJ-like exonuclease